MIYTSSDNDEILVFRPASYCQIFGHQQHTQNEEWKGTLYT